MLSVQLDVSTSEAFARLRAHAISSERSITAVSQDIVDGTLDFRDLD
jgi:AmiR/NasT family two-component response regulator